MTPGLPHFLALGVCLFGFGLYTVLTRDNAIGLLMGIELILNAANLNFVAFHHFNAAPLMEGQVFALVVVVLAACEAAVGLGIVLALHRAQHSIDVSEADTLRE